ncbi:MAG: rRNA maturation RNase YbeY, partial [Richelia sp. RM2_1_2]|nr:rRNA maturation RNase YbeY [Richelia sp. RM2_1_2]
NVFKKTPTTFIKPFEEEFQRVLAHGILHLVGYEDEDEEQELRMRNKEDFYLSQL